MHGLWSLICALKCSWGSHTWCKWCPLAGEGWLGWGPSQGGELSVRTQRQSKECFICILTNGIANPGRKQKEIYMGCFNGRGESGGPLNVLRVCLHTVRQQIPKNSETTHPKKHKLEGWGFGAGSFWSRSHPQEAAAELSWLLQLHQRNLKYQLKEKVGLSCSFSESGA